MAKSKPREIWRSGKYKLGWRAFWQRQPYDESRSYAWREGWLAAQYEAMEEYKYQLDYEAAQRYYEQQWHKENPHG